MNQGYYNNGYNNNPYYNQNPNMYPNRMMPQNGRMPVNGQRPPTPNNGNMPTPQKPKNSSGVKKMLPLIIIAGVLGLILVILFVVLLVKVVFNKSTPESPPQQNPDPSVVENNNKKVGTDTHGYVEVPNDWVAFYDTQVTDTTLIQFSSQDKKYIISLGYFPVGQTDSKKAAAALALNLKNANATDLKAWDDITIGSYTNVYKVQGTYTDGITLAGYFFQTSDGATRCVMIEGPNKDDKSFGIPYTFTMNSNGDSVINTNPSTQTTIPDTNEKIPSMPGSSQGSSNDATNSIDSILG